MTALLMLQSCSTCQIIYELCLILYHQLSLNVSLTYLRGLEVEELKEEEMPMV